MRRVVVTGMGVVSPLGNSVTELWSKLITKQSGVVSLTHNHIKALDELDVKIGGTVKISQEDQTILPFAPNKQNAMAFLASKLALEDAGWSPTSEKEQERTGVFLGAPKSHLAPVLAFLEKAIEEGPQGVPGVFFDHTSIFGTTANVVRYFNFKGPTSAYGSACSAGKTSIAEAFHTIQEDDADVMVAGNSDHGIHPYLIGGLSRVGALNKKYNHSPAEGSRPFDEKREGFVAADGSGVLVLEELEHAKRRGARIYAELLGVSMNTESYHPTRPDIEGRGMQKAMRLAISKAGLKPQDVDVVHSHGTSTTEGDYSEALAIHRLFGPPGPVVFSVKSSIGHMMGGVGGIQAAVLIMALNHNKVPPILNLENPLTVEGHTLNFARDLVEKEIKVGISNNAGFGGLNCCLVFSKI